jgi:hypothetical protein
VDRLDPPESPAEKPTVDDPPAEPTGPQSSIGDYVRELQREYDEEQEEGRIDLADTD